MPEQIPPCRNAVKNKDHVSDMRMKAEGTDFWLFQCSGCELTHVISKDGVRNASQFNQAKKRMEQEVERRRRWGKRPKIFV